MKKVLHISLILLLLTGVTGVTVANHYCHGALRFTRVAVDGEHESCCGSADAVCGSCEDRIRSSMMDEDGLVTGYSPVSDQLVALPVAEAATARLQPLNLASSDTFLYPPPRYGSVDISILNNSFLI